MSTLLLFAARLLPLKPSECLPESVLQLCGSSCSWGGGELGGERRMDGVGWMA